MAKSLINIKSKKSWGGAMFNLISKVYIRPRLRIVSVVVALTLSSCVSVSPQRITTDRMDYGQVVADSWKRQTLLNVVRLRYSDAPVFLDVSSIINSYSVGGKASAKATLPERTDPNVFELGAEGAWSNTPTVTYQPLLGDRFTKSLLQPISPTSVFQLMQSGWPADLVLQTVVGSINGLRNSALGLGADPRFYELVEALSRIQRNAGLGIRVEPRKDSNSVLVVMRHDDTNDALMKDSLVIQDLLNLKNGISEFEIAYGLVPKTKHEVAMLSRSMLEIMLQLGLGIDIPSEHLKDGRVLMGAWKSDNIVVKPLVHILSAVQRPEDAYAAVPYKGYWYWIDDKDVASKRTFTFLMILFSLAETGQATAGPVVTVPSR
jgi:hypothetical protein